MQHAGGDFDGRPAPTRSRDFRVNVQKASNSRTGLVEGVIKDTLPPVKHPLIRRVAMSGQEARRKRFTPQPAMSPLPVHVLPSGQVSDDSIRELDLLQSAIAAMAAGPRETDSQRSLFVTSSFSKLPLPISAN